MIEIIFEVREDEADGERQRGWDVIFHGAEDVGLLGEGVVADLDVH